MSKATLMVILILIKSSHLQTKDLANSSTNQMARSAVPSVSPTIEELPYTYTSQLSDKDSIDKVSEKSDHQLTNRVTTSSGAHGITRQHSDDTTQAASNDSIHTTSLAPPHIVGSWTRKRLHIPGRDTMLAPVTNVTK
ncbi:hypothetical protein BaRGS_00017670, partial [Batillaria attramentaria]